MTHHLLDKSEPLLRTGAGLAATLAGTVIGAIEEMTIGNWLLAISLVTGGMSTIVWVVWRMAKERSELHGGLEELDRKTQRILDRIDRGDRYFQDLERRVSRLEGQRETRSASHG